MQLSSFNKRFIRRQIRAPAPSSYGNQRAAKPGDRAGPVQLDKESTVISGALRCGVIHGAPPADLSSVRPAARWVTRTSCRDPLVRQTGVVDRIGRLAVMRLTRPAGVKEIQIHTQIGFGVRDRVVSLQIHLLVFDPFPKPLDKYVVAPAALAETPTCDTPLPAGNVLMHLRILVLVLRKS